MNVVVLASEASLPRRKRRPAGTDRVQCGRSSGDPAGAVKDREPASSFAERPRSRDSVPVDLRGQVLVRSSTGADGDQARGEGLPGHRQSAKRSPRWIQALGSTVYGRAEER